MELNVMHKVSACTFHSHPPGHSLAHIGLCGSAVRTFLCLTKKVSWGLKKTTTTTKKKNLFASGNSNGDGKKGKYINT